MKGILFCMAALLSICSSYAADGKKAQKALKEPSKTVLLYPKGQNVNEGIIENGVNITLGPGESNGCTGPEKMKDTGNISNTGDSARMYLYLPKKCNGQMIIVCPGGGYSNTAARHEGHWVAEWLSERGIATCVLIYRMPNFVHPQVPVTDVQNAFRYCRAHAEEWGVKQIGVMGFSAGGHLAACASTLFVDEITRPDFSVLIYPVISFDENVGHGGTMMEMTEKGQRKDLVEYYSLEKRITENTPAAILILSADDNGVKPENSIRYFENLRAKNVQSEMYILPFGGHGWGWKTADRSTERLTDGTRDVFFHCLDNYLERMSLNK